MWIIDHMLYIIFLGPFLLISFILIRYLIKLKPADSLVFKPYVTGVNILKDKCFLIKDLIQGEIYDIRNKRFLNIDTPVVECRSKGNFASMPSVYYEIKGSYKGRSMVCSASYVLIHRRGYILTIELHVRINAKLNKKFMIDYPRITEHVRFKKDEWLIASLSQGYFQSTAALANKITRDYLLTILEELIQAARKVETDSRYTA